MGLDLSALDGGMEWKRPDAVAGIASRAALALFDVDADNPRFEDDPSAFGALVADIAERGILQPIVVRRDADGRLRIRFGERRYLAAVELGLAEVPYVVTDDERQFNDYSQVAENERRSSLQPLELATFISKKLALGERKKSVAARLHIDPSAVTHLLALTGDVPACVLELYHARRCRLPVYLYEIRKLSERDSKLVARRCTEAGEIDRRFIDALAVEVGAGQGIRPGDNGSGIATPLSSPSLECPAGDKTRENRMSAKECVGETGVGEFDGAAMRLSGRQLLKRPALQGTYRGREIFLLVSYRPSASELVVVSYRDDSSWDEVPLAEIKLTLLGEGPRGRRPTLAKRSTSTAGG